MPGAADPAPLAAWHLGPLVVSVSVRALVAIAVILSLAIVQTRGVGPGRVLQNLLTMLKIVALVGGVAIGFLVAGLSGGHPMPPTAPVRLTGWLMALVPVMFSYSGWNAAVYVAEEIRDPVRNVPRALAIGTGATVALYLALNALYLRVVPFEQFSGKVAVGEVAAERLFGSAAGYLFAVVAILIILSSLSAMTTAGPRVYFAMARDGAFLPAAARIHPRFRTPAIAIVAQAAWSALLVLSGHVRAAAHVHRVRRHPVFGAGGALAVLRAPYRDAGRDVPCVGLSLGARALLHRQLRHRASTRSSKLPASRPQACS